MSCESVTRCLYLQSMNKISYNKHTVKPRMLLLSIEAATLGVLPVLACTGGQTVHFTAAVHLLITLYCSSNKEKVTEQANQHNTHLRVLQPQVIM